MGKKIYWAASLHSDVMRAKNEELACLLRANGLNPLLPQWSGVWEDMMKEELQRGVDVREAKIRVKRRCFEMDIRDMDEAEACILFAPAIPSEGACFELGYCYAKCKPCCLYVPDDIVYDEINLMITKSSPRFNTFDEVLDWCREIDINIAAQQAMRHLAIFRKEDNSTDGVPAALRGLSDKSGSIAIENAKRWVEKQGGEYSWMWV